MRAARGLHLLDSTSRLFGNHILRKYSDGQSRNYRAKKPLHYEKYFNGLVRPLVRNSFVIFIESHAKGKRVPDTIK